MAEAIEEAGNANEWELCKENVQPLRKGRKFANLSAALQSNSTDLQNKIRQQKQEFELELRTYSGDDPLEVWYQYIKWTEQTFPKGGKEGNIIDLLERCVQLFNDVDKYKNDFRYVDAWLKLANHQSEPLEIFNFMFNHGIGCLLADFYCAWAGQLEEVGNHKKADTIYQQGLKAGVHSHDLLKTRHAEFQARVARKTVEDGISPMETSEPASQRMTLGQLKGHGKNKSNVGSSRMNAQKPQGLGYIAPQAQQKGGQSFSVFSEDQPSIGVRHLPPQTAEYKSVPQKAKMRAENEQKAGVWSNAKVKQKTVGTVPINQVSQHNKPVFPIHTDDEMTNPPATPRQTVRMDTNQALSARKPQEQHNTLEVITNPGLIANNPGEMPMYCKTKVYGGLRELQFEEIHAARWFKKRKEREMERRRAEEERKRNEQHEKMIEMVRHQQEELGRHRQLLLEFEEKQAQAHRAMEESQEKNDRLAQQLQEKLKVQDESSSQEINRSTHNISRHLPFQETSKPAAHNNSAAIPNHSGFKIFDENSPGLQPMDSSASSQSFASQPTPMSFNIANKSGMNVFEDQATPASQPRNMFEGKHNQESITIHEDPAPVPARQPFQQHEASMTRIEAPAPVPARQPFQQHEASMTRIDNPAPVPARQPFQQHEAGMKRVEAPAPVNMRQPFQQREAGIKIHEDPTPTQTGRQPFLTCETIPEDSQLAVPPFASMNQDKTPKEKMTNWASHFNTSRSREPTPDSFYNFKDSGGRNRESMTAPSPTVNTKEALHLVMGMFNNTIEPEANYGGWEQDGDPIIDTQMETEFAVQPDSAKPFMIFDENRAQPPKAAEAKCQKSGQDMNDQENRAPADYRNPPKRLGLSGVLQPSVNVPCQTQGDEEEDEDMDGIMPLPDGDMTFAPCAESTKKFSVLANMVSTPFQNGQIAPLPNPAFSNIDNNRTCFDKTHADTEKGDISLSHVELSDNGARPLFTKEELQKIANPSPARKFPRPSMGAGQLTPIMEGSSIEKSSGNSDNSNNVFCQTGFSSHHPVTELETVSEESLQALSINESKRETSRLAPPPIVDEFEMTCHHINVTGYEPEETENIFDLLSKSIAIDPSNPFDLDLIDSILARLPVSLSSYPNYTQCEGKMPVIQKSKQACMISLGDEEYNIVEKIGEGAFGKVYLSTVIDLDDLTGEFDGTKCVVKVQSPSCPWEFYICTELEKRLRQLQQPVDATPFVLSIDKAFFFSDGCCFVSVYHKHGSLLNLVNAFKSKAKGAFMPESIVCFLTIVLLRILEYLMSVQIIHGDIKPDNFLFIGMPQAPSARSVSDLLRTMYPIKLIDFGRSIDMTMFDPGTNFTAKVDTSGFQCIEMKTGRPWTYQTDFFNTLGTIHVLALSSYMHVFQCKVRKTWKSSSKFRRNWKGVDLWHELFDTFLNIPSCDDLPDVTDIRLRFERFFEKDLMESYLSKDCKLVEMMLMEQ